MYYCGARPEEVGGDDGGRRAHDAALGWYLHITDLPSTEDDDGLFAEDDEASPHRDVEDTTQVQRRHLKNAASRRNIPVAPQLIELGLLRYVEYVKAKASVRLFPTLRPDTHGKLSGAHGKFFGRYKVELGIKGGQKDPVLASSRHEGTTSSAPRCLLDT
jgi:hypothetical protein